MNEQDKKLVSLIDQLSKLSNDGTTAKDVLDEIVSQIQEESTKGTVDNYEVESEREPPFDGNKVSDEIRHSLEAKNSEYAAYWDRRNKELIDKQIEDMKQHGCYHDETLMMKEAKVPFTFTRIREVKAPGKAHPTDAGIDFYVPDEKAWDDEFKNKVIEMSRNPIPPPDDGSTSDDSKDSLALVDFLPGYETIGGEHRPMSIIVRPGGHVAIPSGIKTIIPQGLGMMFVNKSGVATKMKLDHSACLVDSEYRDEIIMCFFNHSTEPVQIEPGMKITQGLIVPIINVEIQEVLNCVYDDMGKETDRGGGFGSSGTK